MEGSVFEALKVHQLWLLEISNYLVYRAWKWKEVDWIEVYRDQWPERAGRLPPREYLRSLDPTRLRLVRTELPEDEWYSLALVNDLLSESEELNANSNEEEEDDDQRGREIGPE